MRTCNYSNNVNFNALKVAETRNVFHNKATKIDIYKLGKEDADLLKTLNERIKSLPRIPEIGEYEQNRWIQVYKYGLDSAVLPGFETYVAIAKNSMPAILTLLNEGSSMLLDCICAFPCTKKEKINFVGKTLFLQAFKNALESRVNAVKLDAVMDGPVDVISKYKELGFTTIGNDGQYEQMRCNKFKVKEQFQKLSEIIQYKPVKSDEIVDLNVLI